MNSTAAFGELVVTVLGLVVMYVAFMRYRGSRRTKPDRDKGPSVNTSHIIATETSFSRPCPGSSE